MNVHHAIRREPPSAQVISPPEIVLVVDDDPLMRSALSRLLSAAGIATELYSSGVDFLAEARLDRPGCVLLDINMPGMSGLEVQARLNQRRVAIPIIFLTASADVPIAVAAMREGAADFVEKPFETDHLLLRVRQAIDRHHRFRKIEEERQLVLTQMATLTPREHEILELVVTGKTSKLIARELGMSHRTVEIHRAHLMEKMMASTLADLVRMRLLTGDDSPPDHRSV